MGFEDPAAVAAAEENIAGAEEAKENVSNAQTKRIEAMLSQTIQRLSDRRFMKKETPQEKEARLAREKEEREEQEAREKAQLEQQEIRRKRKEERLLLESKTKKKLKFCAAIESDEENNSDWE